MKYMRNNQTFSSTGKKGGWKLGRPKSQDGEIEVERPRDDWSKGK